MKTKAIEYQTVKYSHPRPCVDFGDLTAPEGNAFIVHGRAGKTLEVHGFTAEAKEIHFLACMWKPSYDTVFDKLAFFLTLEAKPQEINLQDMAMQALAAEGDEIVFKISRKDYDKRQEEIYDWEEASCTTNYWDKKTVLECLGQSDMFLDEVSSPNSLGKNMLSYIYSIEDFKNIEQKLIDDGANTQDIENLLTAKDLSNSCALNSMLWNMKKSSTDEIKKALELQIYLKHTYPKAFDFTSEDTFGRNYITQFFPVAEKLRNSIKELQRHESGEELFGAVAYFENWLQTLKPETGFSNAYNHNEELLNNTNPLWKSGGVEELLDTRLMSGYTKIKINLEKNILEEIISLNNSANPAKMAKIKV